MQDFHTCVGQMVQFVLTEDMCQAINRRRDDAYDHLPQIQEAKAGYIAHVGNPPCSGEIVPMIITRVWEEDRVNGQIILDGNDHYWATSVARGSGYGEWDFPESFAQPREDLPSEAPPPDEPIEAADKPDLYTPEASKAPATASGTDQETAAGGNKQAEEPVPPQPPLPEGSQQAKENPLAGG